MKTSYALLAVAALAPTLIFGHPANTTLLARDSPSCNFFFTTDPCNDHSKNRPSHEGYDLFRPKKSNDIEVYTPHPELPPQIHTVSHCYDFIDPSYNGDWEARYDINGRTIRDFDPRPMKYYEPNQAHLWMFEDKCQKEYEAIAMFDSLRCEGSYVWYNLPVMRGKQASNIEHSGDDWCVAPFTLTNADKGTRLRVSSFQMWEKAPNGEAFGSRVV